jgi:tetratricopeptide (TPR) repeat protein
MKRFLLIIAALLLGGMLSVVLIAGTFRYPLPPAQTPAVARYALFDMAALLAGARRLGADIAWIQMLQYYGTPEKPVDKDAEFRLSWDMTRYLFGSPVEKEVCREAGCMDKTHYHPEIEGGVYPELLAYCDRVVSLDPFFDHVYLYGAGALAWNLNRPQEALDLLARGIRTMERYRANMTSDVHQPFWQLHLYASAIVYRQSGQFDRMIAQLEVAVRQPDCPAMVKAILANIYQKEGKYAPALALWISVYDSGDPSYRARALEKVAELKSLLCLPA